MTVTILAALLAAVVSAVVTFAATSWRARAARRDALEAEARARSLEWNLREAAEQLRPVPGYRPVDLTGWGSRGLVYGGPGGAAALMAALVGASLARGIRDVMRGDL